MVMLMRRGMVARRVRRPRRRRVPQRISTVPTKGPVKAGKGMPMAAKRPAPLAADRKNVVLTLKPSMRALDKMDTITETAPTNDDPMKRGFAQVPAIHETELNTMLSVPSRKSVVIRGMKFAGELPIGKYDGGFKVFYQQLLRGSTARLVSVDILPLVEYRTIRLIVKSHQQPSGMVYSGSFTIPFRDFSFVVKAQCQEHGMTGIREAILLDRQLKAGSVFWDASGPIIGDWNPDDEGFDSEFPEHPLTRLRSILRNVETSCRLDPTIRRFAAFDLP
jgi:hypothetical protein